MTSNAPSPELLHSLRHQLRTHAPFSQMQAEHVERFIEASRFARFASDDVVLAPASGPVMYLYFVQEGGVVGQQGLADAAGGFRYDTGDLFPVGAALGRRAVSATYVADGDTSCWMLPGDEMDRLAQDSPPFADFLNRRVVQFLDISRRALQASYLSQSLAEQSLESTLGSLTRRTPLAVLPDTSLQHALALMHQRQVGSILVNNLSDEPVGILTRHDVLGRVTLPQIPLSTPIAQVMSQPIRVLQLEDTAQDALLLMSREGIRHVPVVDKGKAVSMVSERDLFALHRLSLKQVSTGIRSSTDVQALQLCATKIRELTRQLMGQGVHARQLTELISHLNDLLAERLVSLMAARHGLKLDQACWLAFGSEGRSEQTVSTDQDNGLVFVCEPAQRDNVRQQWLALARDVNQALDACGYPLCPGNIMASNPACCLTQDEWLSRFDRWMEQGSPQDLLNASIFFDLRAVAGDKDLAERLRGRITAQAANLPRFIKQLAVNALTHRPPLSWRGSIETHPVDGRSVIDAKLQGTAIFVDVARIYALAHGDASTSTRARLASFAQSAGVAAHESQAWITGFEFLQTLRLRVQIDASADKSAATPHTKANLVDVQALNDIDRRVLREALRVARQLQQRLELDYRR